jgi:hypothetical protein
MAIPCRGSPAPRPIELRHRLRRVEVQSSHRRQYPRAAATGYRRRPKALGPRTDNVFAFSPAKLLRWPGGSVLTTIAVLLGFAAVSGYVALASRLARSVRDDELDAAGLLRGRFGGRQGVIDGFEVTIGPPDVSQLLSVAVPALPEGLRLEPGRADEAARTGDPMFDHRFRAQVPPDALGWLAPSVRRALRAFERVEIVTGTVRLWCRPVSRADLPVALRLARTLQNHDPVNGLREIVTHDDAVRLRVRAAALLDAGIADSVSLRTAADHLVVALLRARRPEVLARIVLDAPRDETFQLVRGLVDLGRGDVVAALVEQLDPSRWTVRSQLRSVIVGAAAQMGSPQVEAALLRVVNDPDRVPDPVHGDATLVLELLLSVAAPTLAPRVVALLPRAEHHHERAGAWLARHGSVADVPALDAMVEGPSVPGRLLMAATEAKRGIQARAAGDRGGLAFARVAGGELSSAGPADRRDTGA